MSILGTRARVWSQSMARKALLGEESQNPSLAARALLGRTVVRRATQFARRIGRRRRQPGNPLPAFAGIVGALPGIGAKFDKKKHAQRIARIDQWAANAMAGKATDYHVQVLTDIANGAPTALVATYDEIRAYAAAKLAPITAALEKREEQRAEQKAVAAGAAAAAAARAERREERFTGVAASVGGALAQGFGRRGSRRPARRRRRSSYY